ncbi:MAG TPA: hypothetical protein VGR96_14565 [Acidobacteriaceae bacterium]|nr:hypothetical protein [Acidobacteriaceae bacterium]
MIRSIPLLVIASLLSPWGSTSVRAESPAESAHDLVRDVIYNELRDRSVDSYWEYRVEKRVVHRRFAEEQIETPEGPVFRVLSRDGKPLDPAEQKQETARLEDLIRNPGKQAKAKQEHEADEQRLERLMKAMPDAFEYAYDGAEGHEVRLKFQPNPAYVPPTYETRIYHALSGEMWIDPQQKRLLRVNGKLIEQVDFGFGLLGRVEKGGTFDIRREQVNPTHWKTDWVNVQISGHLILFKSVSADQREVRSNFRPVPQNLSLRQAVSLLETPAGSQIADASASRTQ